MLCVLKYVGDFSFLMAGLKNVKVVHFLCDVSCVVFTLYCIFEFDCSTGLSSRVYPLSRAICICLTISISLFLLSLDRGSASKWENTQSSEVKE